MIDRVKVLSKELNNIYDELDQLENVSEDIVSQWTMIDGKWTKNEKEIAEFKKLVNNGWVSQSGSSFCAAPYIEKILPPNVYTFRKSDQGLFFDRQFFPSDIPILLPGLPCKLIVDQINTFWNKKEEYEKYGLIHKRGIMLYGVPGCGKTSIVRLLTDEIIKLGGVVFAINDFQTASEFCTAFRRSEPERPILTIQEDIEGLFTGDEGAAQIKAALSFLDGQDQVSNIVHIATTNEPEKIADRFIKRPGRFDLVIGIHEPKEETRRAYLQHVCKNQIENEQLEVLTKKTEGLGLAYLREIAASYLCLGIPIEDTLERLKKNKKTGTFKNKNSKQMGFTIGYEGGNTSEDE